MLFHVMFMFTDQSEESEKRSLEVFAKWSPPEGADFQSFYGFADGTGGVAIVEVDSALTLGRTVCAVHAVDELHGDADPPDRRGCRPRRRGDRLPRLLTAVVTPGLPFSGRRRVASGARERHSAAGRSGAHRGSRDERWSTSSCA